MPSFAKAKKALEVASRRYRPNRLYRSDREIRAEEESRGCTIAQESRGFGFTAKASEVTEWLIKAE